MTTTPSARAREAAKVLSDYLAIRGLKDGELQRAFARFEAEIRADERERCAKVADAELVDTFDDSPEEDRVCNVVVRTIATAIRENRP